MASRHTSTSSRGNSERPRAAARPRDEDVQPGLLSDPPSGDPLRPVSEARALVRLASVTGWRAAGLEALAPAELGGVPMESRLRATLPPWSTNDGVTFRLERRGGGGGHGDRSAPD